DPLLGWHQRSSGSLKLAHRGIAVYPDHKDITPTASALKIAHVADVEEIKTPISPHDGLFFLPGLRTPLQERIPRYRFTMDRSRIGAITHGSHAHSTEPVESAARAAVSDSRSAPLARRSASVDNSAATRVKTPSQSPGACWRNSRMVGYQGLSSRSSNQR